eukprot:356367_1
MAHFVYATIISVASSIIVSEHGSDHSLCGSKTHPCGSLYYASTIINSNSPQSNINLTIHGQNTTLLRNYIHDITFTSAYHPCLPQPFDHLDLLIRFDLLSIRNMTDWYPPICLEYDANNTTPNKYMFQATHTKLTIHNLFIDMAPYAAFGIPFGIIGVFTNVEGSTANIQSQLECFNCVFTNIHHTNPGIVLLYSTRFITFEHCTFTNIHTITDFIVMNAGVITLSHVEFRDSVTNESLIHIETDGETTYGKGQFTVSIKQCQFVNIASHIALIYDQYISSHVTIHEVVFDGIHGGSIYRAYYQSNAEVHVTNVYISTPQVIVSTTNTLYSLLEFHFAEPVTMRNVTVHYQYDMNAHCERSDDGSGVIGTTASASHITYLRMLCHNPISLMRNSGAKTVIHNMDLSINITADDVALFKDNIRDGYDYVYLVYAALRDSHYGKNALILNYGNLTINSITVHGLPSGYQMIVNYAELSVIDLNMRWDSYGLYDPNVLQSDAVIVQTGLWPNTVVIDSHFDGGGMWSQILMYSGTLTVRNTIFEHSGNALLVKSGQAITVSNCTFIRIGRYWADISTAVYRDSYDINPINVKYVDEIVVIEGSTFNGFQDCMSSVFIQLSRTYEVILRDSSFVVNSTNYYNVNAFGGCGRWMYGFVFVFLNYAVSIYGNVFHSNTIFLRTPWISLDSNGYDYDSRGLSPIPSCVSGNNFSNIAFEFYTNNITSCFRHDLYLCVDRHCNHGQFGNINAELFNKTSHFNIDSSAGVNTFFTLVNGKQHFVHAMDNIQINIIGDGASWTLNFANSYMRLIILDSIFPHNMQIEYDTSCNITQYDQLEQITQYVAHFEMFCGARTNENMAMNTSLIQPVDHLTPTQIHFTSTTWTYFPGQQLTFDFRIFDKLNYDCDDFLFHDRFYEDGGFTVSLESDSLNLHTNIGIEDDGICDLCVRGVVILGVALKEFFVNGTLSNTTDTVFIQTSIDNSNLILIKDIIELHVTSCPVGYGSDPNDIQCLICPDGTYNLSPNNTNHCEDCNEDTNDGVICHGGHILIALNWWLGFCGANDSMVTNICPTAYCCQMEGFCDFSEDNQAETLCAHNRNVSEPLCGACFEGYTEAINSPQCMICEEQHWMWFSKPIALAIVYTLYLIFSNPIKEKDTKQRDEKEVYVTYTHCSCLGACINQCKAWAGNTDFVLLCQTLVLRVLLYYEQALGSVMWPSFSSPYMAEIYTIASIFNLETSVLNTDSDAKCLFEGLTSKNKILLAFLPWLLIFVLLLVSYTYVAMRFTPNRCKCGNANFSKAFVGLFIICVSQVLSILFKLLNCQRVGELLVHFYFGSEECFASWTMVVSFVCLSFVAVFFAAMFYIVYRYFTPEDRENPNFALNDFCKYYKPECYYWEWLVLLRRSLISAYAILYTWNWYPSILVSVLLVCLGLHHQHQPFRSEAANVAEYFALCGVIVVITIQTTTTSVGSSVGDATLVVLSSFIVVPIIAVIGYIIGILKRIPTLRHEREDDTCLEEPEELRLLKSKNSVEQAVSIPAVEGHARFTPVSDSDGVQIPMSSGSCSVIITHGNTDKAK